MSHPANDQFIDDIRDFLEELAVIRSTLETYVNVTRVLNVDNSMLEDIHAKLSALMTPKTTTD